MPTLRAYFDSHLPPAEGRSAADEFIAERRAEAEAAHEASGGQPGTWAGEGVISLLYQ